MSIVRSELKKMWKNPVILIVILIFMALDLFNIYRNYNIKNGVEDYYVSGQLILENQLDGAITDEKVSTISSNVSTLNEQCDGEFAEQKEPDSQFITGYAFWDLQLWTSYENYIDRAEEYSENLSAKLDTALENVEYYSDKNEFYSIENQLYYNTYNGRQITEIYDTDRLPDYFKYSFSSVLIIVVLLLGVVPIFCNEYECNMNTILLTSYCGRRKTVNSKITASLIFTLIVAILFFLCDFAGFMIFDRIDGLNQVIYAIQGYENIPLNLKVWQFCILLLIMKLIGMWIISLVFLLLSRLFKKSVMPFTCGLVVVFVMMICKVFLTTQTGQIINIFNPITLLTSYNVLSDFNVINAFGNPVFMWQILIFAGLVIMIILCAIISFLPLNIQWKVRCKK
jgi:hypothetical protein